MSFRLSKFILPLLILAIGQCAFAQTAKEWRCTGNADIAWDVQIDGCTAAIRSGKYIGKKLNWAYDNRGIAYNNNKQDYDRAISDFDEAIRLDPKDVLAYNNRGAAYLEKQDYDRAISDFDEAIRLDPKYALTYYHRGIAYRDKQDYDRAISDYDEAIRLSPKKIGMAYTIGPSCT